MKQIKKWCERCRYLLKRCINVAMGSVLKYNSKIAPPFYISQDDLEGPFKAHSPYNKRATIKIWLAVFCCSTTLYASLYKASLIGKGQSSFISRGVSLSGRSNNGIL